MTVRKPLVLIGGRVSELPSGDYTPVSVNAGVDPILACFNGTLTAATGTYRYYHPAQTTIISANLSVGTASTSGSITVDVKLNGTSILAGLLTLASGQNVSTPVSLNVAITPSDYLTVDIVSAGTGAKDMNVYLGVSASFQSASVPASASASGTPGQWAYDSNYFYMCVAIDTWKRVAITTW